MAKNEPQAIRFSAQPSKFTTLVDGTKRIYLDLVRTDKETNAEILETVGVPGVLWEVAAVAVKAEKLTEVDDDEKNQPTDEEAKGSGTRVDRRRFAVKRDQ